MIVFAWSTDDILMRFMETALLGAQVQLEAEMTVRRIQIQDFRVVMLLRITNTNKGAGPF